MKKGTSYGAEKRKENLCYGVAAVLFPTAILCYFLAQNINEFAALWLIYFMLGVLIVLAVLAYCAALLMLRRGFLALVFCIVGWIGCYLEPMIRGTLFENASDDSHILRYIVLMILAVAAFVLYLLRHFERDMQKPVTLFSIILALLLVVNLLPIVKTGFDVKLRVQEKEIPYQTDFFIDSAKTDTPNVYWIHADGMTSVNVVKKYFNEDQSEFLSGLAARDFSINPSAHFEAGAATVMAIPALTSPYAYDTWLSDYTVTHETAKAARTYAFLEKLREVRSHNEMIAAFDKKGYASSVISLSGEIYYRPAFNGSFYDIANSVDEIEIYNGDEKLSEKGLLLQNLSANMRKVSYFLELAFELLYKMVFLVLPSESTEDLMQYGYRVVGAVAPFTTKMPEEMMEQILPSSSTAIDESDRKTIRSLYDILHRDVQAQKLSVITQGTAHYPFKMDENGVLADYKYSKNPIYYYPQHAFAAKLLINMVDMILEADPDAVIVIQGDHGLHGNTEKQFKTAFGKDADAIELWNGTMSAIRVPEKYRTGEEHYALENPLNISRYLVNSFVGENYEYLPPN